MNRYLRPRVSRGSWFSASLVLAGLALAVGCSGSKGAGPAPVNLPPPVAPAVPANNDQATSEALSLLQDASLPPETVTNLIGKLAAEHSGSAGVEEALGKAWEKRGDDNKAIAAYRKAVAIDPNRPDAWLRLGILLKRNGRDLDGSIAAFDKALDTGAPRARTLNELGVAYAYKGQLKKALGVWDDAIHESPSWGVLYANALKASLQLKNEDLARQYYDRGKNIAHPEMNLPLQWGEYLADSGKTKDAIAVYNDAAVQFPKSAMIAYYHAQALRQAGETDAARKEFHRAIDLDPNGPKGKVATWSKRALFIVDYPEAEKDFQEYVKEYFKATKLEGEKQTARMKELQPKVKALVDSHPEFWNAWSLLAWIDRRLKMYSDAHQCLDRVLDIYPNEPNALHEMGLLYREEGKLEDAHRYILKAHKLAPRDPTVLMNLALTEIDLGLWDQAKKRIEEVESRYGEEAGAPLRDYYTERRSGKNPHPGERPEVPIGQFQ